MHDKNLENYFYWEQQWGDPEPEIRPDDILMPTALWDEITGCCVHYDPMKHGRTCSAAVERMRKELHDLMEKHS